MPLSIRNEPLLMGGWVDGLQRLWMIRRGCRGKLLQLGVPHHFVTHKECLVHGIDLVAVIMALILLVVKNGWGTRIMGNYILALQPQFQLRWGFCFLVLGISSNAIGRLGARHQRRDLEKWEHDDS